MSDYHDASDARKATIDKCATLAETCELPVAVIKLPYQRHLDYICMMMREKIAKELRELI